MELKTNNIIYHVETLEDLIDLAERLDKLGCKWSKENKLNDKVNLAKLFEMCSDLCFRLEDKYVNCAERMLYESSFPHIPIVTYEKPIEKPLIPEYVADWIERCKNKGLSLGYVLYKSNYADEKKVRKWLGILENQPIFARAWVDGYGIEKEQLYKIPLKGLITSDGEQQFLTGKYGKYYASRKNVNLKQTFDQNELDNNVPKWCRGFVKKVKV